MENEYYDKHQRLPVTETRTVASNNLFSSAMDSRSGESVMIYRICLAMMRNSTYLYMWLKQCWCEVISQYGYRRLHHAISIYCLNCHRTGRKLIRIIMIKTPTLWTLPVHFESRISPTGGIHKKTCTHSTPICLI